MTYLTHTTYGGIIKHNQKIMEIKKMFNKLINIIKNIIHKRKQKEIFIFNTIHRLKKKHKIFEYITIKPKLKK